MVGEHSPARGIGLARCRPMVEDLAILSEYSGSVDVLHGGGHVL
jgi:hypothetical protein